MHRKTFRLLTVLCCIGVGLSLVTSCSEQRPPNGVIVALKESKGATFDSRGYLFVVSDTEVLSFAETKRLASTMADAFGYTTMAIVDPQSYHILDHQWPHELLVIGSSYPRLLDQNPVLLFPRGAPPKSVPKRIAVVLNGERGNAEWQSWCHSADVPCVVVTSARNQDIFAAIKTAEAALADREHGKIGAAKDAK